MTTTRAATATDFQSSRCRASSTSRTMGLFRTSLRIAYSNASDMLGLAHCRALCRAQLRAARARISFDFPVARNDWLFRQQRDCRVGSARERSEGVLHDAIFERVKRDHREASAGAQAMDRLFEELVEPFELAVHPDPQRLKGARGRIDALVTPMP